MPRLQRGDSAGGAGELCRKWLRSRSTARTWRALHLHRAQELEVVAVGVGKGCDRRLGLTFELVGLRDHDRAGRLEPREIAGDVLRFDVPDQASRAGVVARYLGVLV